MSPQLIVGVGGAGEGREGREVREAGGGLEERKPELKKSNLSGILRYLVTRVLPA